MPSSSGRSYWASNKSHWYHFLLDSSSVQSNSFSPQNRLPDRVHTIGVCIFQKGKRSFLQLQNLLKVTEEADGKTHMKVLLETKSTFDILTIPQQPGFSECYHQRFVVGRKFTYRAASSCPQKSFLLLQVSWNPHEDTTKKLSWVSSLPT